LLGGERGKKKVREEKISQMGRGKQAKAIPRVVISPEQASRRQGGELIKKRHRESGNQRGGSAVTTVLAGEIAQRRTPTVGLVTSERDRKTMAAGGNASGTKKEVQGKKGLEEYRREYESWTKCREGGICTTMGGRLPSALLSGRTRLFKEKRTTKHNA